MSCKNIDMIAVFVIAVAMAAFSEIQSFARPVEMKMVRLENAANFERCPISSAVLSRIDYLLNQ